MYFAAGESLEMVMSAAAATTNPSYTIAYNDIQSTGMVLPQSSSNGTLTGTTFVTALAAPVAGTTRQLAHFTLYNSDTATVEVIIRKDVSGTDYPFKKVILPVGATLEYSRETGWNVITTQTAYVFSEFTANGTWTKPSNIKFAWVVCIGAGGGGGSGRTGASLTNRTGGGGGGGGAVVMMFLTNNQILDTYNVTVGTQGLGGAAISTINTNGNPGTAGSSSNFGLLLRALGGNSGTGGANATSVNGGATTASTNNGLLPMGGPYAFSGSGGGSGTLNSVSPGGAGFTGAVYTPGGGGGSGITTADIGTTGSVLGGRVYVNSGLTTGPNTGQLSLSNVNCAFFINPTLYGTKGIGEGGSGGNQLFVDGGNAGNYGAGGGGGAGVLNGTTSGKGGNGGGGLVTVLEIY